MLKQFIGGEWVVVGGGGGGSSDYGDLTNKPQINSHTLSGNKSSSDLGLQSVISDLETIRSGAGAGATAVQPATMEAALSDKQDEITDLETIRSGAGAGATAVQTIKINGTAQTKTNGEVDLPAYPTTLPASDTTNSYSASGTAPISGQGVAAALGTLDVSSYGGTGKYIKSISETNGKISPVAGTLATQPEPSNQEPITSDAVYQDQARQDAALVELIDGGAKNIADGRHADTTTDGVAFDFADDGTCTATGTQTDHKATSSIMLSVCTFTPQANVTYVVSGCPTGGSNDTYAIRVTTASDSTVVWETGESASFTPSTSDPLTIKYSIKSGTVCNGLVFKPMICSKAEDTISDAFVPYCPTLSELYAMVKALQARL